MSSAELTKFVASCYQSLIGNAKLCDIIVLITDPQNNKIKKFPIVKAIFAAHSNIFNEVLCTTNDKEISLQNISIKGFTYIQSLFYGLNPQITMENVIDIYYASKHYKINILLNVCIKFINDNISATNYLFLLGNAFKFKLNDLIKTIKEKGKIYLNGSTCCDILNSDYFLSSPQELIINIIQSDELSLKENIIWERCIEWAKKQAQLSQNKLDLINNNDGNDGDDDEKALENDTDYVVWMKKISKYIRFGNMDIKYFTENVIKLNVLNQKEILSIMMYAVDNKNKIVFNTSPRKSVDTTTIDINSVKQEQLATLKQTEQELINLKAKHQQKEQELAKLKQKQQQNQNSQQQLTSLQQTVSKQKQEIQQWKQKFNNTTQFSFTITDTSLGVISENGTRMKSLGKGCSYVCFTSAIGWKSGVHSWRIKSNNSGSQYNAVGVCTNYFNATKTTYIYDKPLGNSLCLWYTGNIFKTGGTSGGTGGQAWSTGDTITTTLNCNDWTVSFYKNGILIGTYNLDHKNQAYYPVMQMCGCAQQDYKLTLGLHQNTVQAAHLTNFTFNQFDKSYFSISENGTRVKTLGNGCPYVCVSSNIGWNAGKHSWQIKSNNSSPSHNAVGVCTDYNKAKTVGSITHSCGKSMAYWFNGYIYKTGGVTAATGLQTWTTNDIMTVILDCGNWNIAFYKNDTLIGTYNLDKNQIYYPIIQTCGCAGHDYKLAFNQPIPPPLGQIQAANLTRFKFSITDTNSAVISENGTRIKTKASCSYVCVASSTGWNSGVHSWKIKSNGSSPGYNVAGVCSLFAKAKIYNIIMGGCAGVGSTGWTTGDTVTVTLNCNNWTVTTYKNNVTIQTQNLTKNKVYYPIIQMCGCTGHDYKLLL